jgi:acylphosphatase
VTGDEKALNEFVNFCKKGPDSALVDEVKVSKREIINFKKFEVIRGG